MPWASVPLVLLGKKLYGQIACDCAHSGRDITRENLAFLTVVGAIASEVIAGHRTAKAHVRIAELDPGLLDRLMASPIIESPTIA